MNAKTSMYCKHIGIAVENIDQVEQQLLAAGIQTFANLKQGTSREFRFCDASGVEFQISGKSHDWQEWSRSWMKQMSKISEYGSMIK